MVDCGLYLSQHHGGESRENTVTLLLDKTIASKLEGHASHGDDELHQQLIRILESGEQGGLEVDTVLTFYTKWQKQSPKK